MATEATSLTQPQQQQQQQAAIPLVSGQPGSWQANWPPCFPKKLLHQDFSCLPDYLRAGTRFFYLMWFAIILMLLYNIAAAIAAATGDSDAVLGWQSSQPSSSV